jgi:hypothetical protein
MTQTRQQQAQAQVDRKSILVFMDRLPFFILRLLSNRQEKLSSFDAKVSRI